MEPHRLGKCSEFLFVIFNMSYLETRWFSHGNTMCLQYSDFGLHQDQGASDWLKVTVDIYVISFVIKQ